MQHASDEPAPGRWTRARLLRAALGGAPSSPAGWRRRAGAAAARPPLRRPRARDAEILNLFLLLEQVQEGFYREAVRGGGWMPTCRSSPRTVGAQETRHVALLTERLGQPRQGPPAVGLRRRA